MTTLFRAAMGCALIAISAGARAQTPGAGFRMLDSIPGTSDPSSVALALSDDASVIVGGARCGASCGQPVRWDSSGRITVLPSGYDRLGWAFDVSGDGRVIVGLALPPGNSTFAGVVWRDGVLEVLPVLPGTIRGMPAAVSTDGSVIAGDLDFPRTYPFPGIVRWVNGKIEDLSQRPGDAPATFADGIDGRGRYVVGVGLADTSRAIRVDKVVEDLGDHGGGGRRPMGATAANADGRRIVGDGQSNLTWRGEAFLWAAPTGIISLGAPPTAAQCSGARAIAGDLPIVVGEVCTNASYFYLAYVWDPIHERRDLNDVLDSHGVDRGGWTVEIVNDITPDGTAMTGMARRGFGEERRAYLLTLPPWCFADCDASGDLDFNDFLCFINRYNNAAADPRAHPIDFIYADLLLDDVIDFGDVLAFMDLYGRGCPK